MREYADGTLSEILETHGVNMQNANVCIARHAAIVEAIERLRRNNEGTD